MARIPCAHAACGPILMGLTGGFVAPRRAPKTPHCAFKISQRSAAPLFATRRAASLQTHPCQPLMGRGRGREDMETHGVAAGDGRRAGKSSRKPRRPRPYSRAFAGISLRSECRPLRPRHAHTMPYMETCGFHNDAARRVATVFEKWNLLIETSLRARGENLPNDPIRGLSPRFPFGIRWSKTDSPVSRRT